MPDIANGRERVNAFLKEKGIKKTTLAVAYGFKRQEVTNILSGTTKGPRANSFILQVIEDYGIEQENSMNELEKTALNEVLRTVTYIAEKLDELELTTAFLKGSVDALKLRTDQFVSDPSSQEH